MFADVMYKNYFLSMKYIATVIQIEVFKIKIFM